MRRQPFEAFEASSTTEAAEKELPGFRLPFDLDVQYIYLSCRNGSDRARITHQILPYSNFCTRSLAGLLQDAFAGMSVSGSEKLPL